MKNMIARIIIPLLLCAPGTLLGKSNKVRAGITYEFSGRFGDNLFLYSRTKYISLITGIPLIYRPFLYSDRLVMHKQEIHENSRKFKKRVVLNKSNFTHMDPTKSILYVLPYCSDFAAERNLPWNHSWMYIPIDWKNPQLVDALTHMIRPIDETLLQVNIPADRISIAVHVRKGTGFDGALLAGAAVKDTKVAYADINVPLKFPPDSYYIEQIKHISELLNHAPLYVFIFTDHDKPAELIEKFKRELPGGTNIEWGFREHGNSHTANVVEDFFAMTLFDCLIYCQSNYSYMASKIARYRISIYPTKHHWQGTQSIVDQVEVVDNRLSFN